MNEPIEGQWLPMSSAPKDGTRVLVTMRPTEQGPAEVDTARWARPDRSGEKCWIAADSDPGAVVIYAETELFGWMPLPAPPSKRTTRIAPGRARPARKVDADESGGSGI